MKENEIKEVLGRVTQYLNEQLWMDFELIEFSRGELKIIGSIDISTKPNIELVFNDVFLASTPFNQKTDTSKMIDTTH